MKINKRIQNIFVCVFTAAFMLTGCKKQEASISQAPPARVDVKTGIVRIGSLDETVAVTGNTSAQKIFQINSPITGIIVDFKFYNGDKIKKGDVIAVVKTKDSQAAINGARALLNNASTPKQRQEAERSLEIAKQNSSEVKIIAPFNGVLTQKLKNSDEFVSEGERIANLIDENSVLFIADVPVELLSNIKIGEHASIIFPSIENKKQEGKIKRINPQVNPQNQTVPVQIQINSRNLTLKNSLFGQAFITVDRHKNSLIVPVKALLHNDENNTTKVFLLTPDSIAYSEKVKVGIKSDSVAEIISPKISAGMSVIVQGHYGLPDSTKVRVLK